ncbi:MAG: substrate-binding domain-containing protein [Actinobacteria bacterium]|nr:substrate-binding domain-containing protein [Actinomycetota bacterium]
MHLGRRIAFIHHSRNSESSLEIGIGVETAAEALGCELLSFDPDFDQERRRQCVGEAIASGPDLIVAAVVAPQLLPDLFAEVAERGIPWIEVGARQQWAPGLTAQVVPDESALTALLDRWMIAALGIRLGTDAPAEIAAWIAPALGEGLLARDRQRARDLAAHPNLSEVETHEIDLGNLVEDIRTSTVAALERHPGLQALWQTCEPCVATQAQALDRLGLSGEQRPLIGGFYSNRATRRLLAERRVDGLVQVDTRVQGLAAVDLAVQHWTIGAPWPGADDDPLAAYGEPLGQPWMITAANVGDDPDLLVPPGPDPVTFFQRQWQSQLGTLDTTKEF